MDCCRKKNNFDFGAAFSIPLPLPFITPTESPLLLALFSGKKTPSPYSFLRDGDIQSHTQVLTQNVRSRLAKR